MRAIIAHPQCLANLMEPALKQRMLGALVLIALAVIFLPMLLDGPPPASDQTTDLAIPPPPQRDLSARVLPVDPPRSRSTGSEPTPAPGGVIVQPLVDTPQVQVTETPEQTTPASTPGTATNAGTGQTPDSASVRPGPGPSVPSDTTAPTQGAATQDRDPQPVQRTDPASTSAPVSTAAFTTVTASVAASRLPAPEASGRHMLQLATLSSQQAANELVTKAKALGAVVSADPVQISGKTLYRIQSGPYATRTAAETVRLALVKGISNLGTPTVVEIDNSEAARAGAETVAQTRALGWAVQLGSFADQANAKKVEADLRGSGFPAFVERLRIDGKDSFRVRAGPFASKAAADKARGEIAGKFADYRSAFVVTHP